MTPQTPFMCWPPCLSGGVSERKQHRCVLFHGNRNYPATLTYSGGLDVRAGDTVRAAADIGLALVAVTLTHRNRC